MAVLYSPLTRSERICIVGFHVQHHITKIRRGIIAVVTLKQKVSVKLEPEHKLRFVLVHFDINVITVTSIFTFNVF